VVGHLVERATGVLVEPEQEAADLAAEPPARSVSVRQAWSSATVRGRSVLETRILSRAAAAQAAAIARRVS
jgi:hypothetical protein